MERELGIAAHTFMSKTVLPAGQAGYVGTIYPVPEAKR